MMKCGTFIENSMINIFLEKSYAKGVGKVKNHTQNVLKKIVPDPSKNQNWVYFWIFVFIQGPQKHIEPKLLITCFYHINAFSKKEIWI